VESTLILQGLSLPRGASAAFLLVALKIFPLKSNEPSLTSHLFDPEVHKCGPKHDPSSVASRHTSPLSLSGLSEPLASGGGGGHPRRGLLGAESSGTGLLSVVLSFPRPACVLTISRTSSGMRDRCSIVVS